MQEKSDTVEENRVIGSRRSRLMQDLGCSGPALGLPLPQQVQRPPPRSRSPRSARRPCDRLDCRRSAQLSAKLQFCLDLLLDELAHAQEQVKRATVRLKGLAEAERHRATTAVLCSVPGVGPITAAASRLELPEPERFDHGGQVARMAGLVPQVRIIIIIMFLYIDHPEPMPPLVTPSISWGYKPSSAEFLCQFAQFATTVLSRLKARLVS